MSEKLPLQMTALPFSEADFIGPEDRPKPEWQITMYRWQGFLNKTVKGWLTEGAPNTILRALQMAPKAEEGIIYAQACDLEAPKFHPVNLSSDHRTATVSLYTPLLPFSFKRVGDDQKVIFKCQPIEVGERKILAIKIADYKVVDVDKETRAQADAADKESGPTTQPALGEEFGTDLPPVEPG